MEIDKSDIYVFNKCMYHSILKCNLFFNVVM
jgi:hypothetical protein